jgi:hypothetical protein
MAIIREVLDLLVTSPTLLVTLCAGADMANT